MSSTGLIGFCRISVFIGVQNNGLGGVWALNQKALMMYELETGTTLLQSRHAFTVTFRARDGECRPLFLIPTVGERGFVNILLAVLFAFARIPCSLLQG
jgi:hypothetical protein